MTADARDAVLTARRAAQHFRLSVPHDAYEYLCILTILPEPRPVSALCWQMHRLLTVLVPLLRVWVHCPRASNGLLPRRSNLVGYVRWDARSDRFLLSDNHSSSLQVANRCSTRRAPRNLQSPLPTPWPLVRIRVLAECYRRLPAGC